MTEVLLVVLIVLGVMNLVILVRKPSRTKVNPEHPEALVDSTSFVLDRLDQVLERIAGAAQTAVDVGHDLRSTAGDVSKDLATAANLQAAQFSRLDVLLDRLTDAVERSRAEAGTEATRVAGNLVTATNKIEGVASTLADKSAAADEASSVDAEPGEVADAGAKSPGKTKRRRTGTS